MLTRPKTLWSRVTIVRVVTPLGVLCTPGRMMVAPRRWENRFLFLPSAQWPTNRDELEPILDNRASRSHRRVLACRASRESFLARGMLFPTCLAVVVMCG